MAVDLTDLVEYLRAATGKQDAATPTDDQLLMDLRNAFWDARLDLGFKRGPLGGYREEDGEIFTVQDGEPDLDRSLQQLVVVWAAINRVVHEIKDMQTLFRAKAGPTEYETQRSAQSLVGVLRHLTDRRKELVDDLGANGVIADTIVDSVLNSDIGLMMGASSWASGSALSIEGGRF